MKRFTFVLALLALIFIGLAAVPAFAQDSTPVPLDTATVTLSVWQVIVGVVAAVASGGILGIAGVGVLANRLRHDAVAITAIEKLGDSVPPETAKQVMDLTGRFNQSVNELTLLVTEALDRIPAATKPPEVPTVPTRFASGNLTADIARFKSGEPNNSD